MEIMQDRLEDDDVLGDVFSGPDLQPNGEEFASGDPEIVEDHSARESDINEPLSDDDDARSLCLDLDDIVTNLDAIDFTAEQWEMCEVEVVDDCIELL